MRQTVNRIRRLWKFRGGVHPPQQKNISTSAPISPAQLPERLVLPLHQHIGEPAEPIVNIGDKVLKGQMIARPQGYVSAPIHAPTSGTVIDIGNYPVPHPSSLSATCMVIHTDGDDRWIEHHAVEDYCRLPPSELRNLIREAGIVGLGGAGFPSYIKFNPGQQKAIQTLILNGVECEPYITCDDLLMRERPQDILSGLLIIQHALQAHECLVAIEDNKPEAFVALRQATEDYDNIEVVQVPTLYPQGSEKQLVKVLTGKEVPADGLALNIGVVCANVGTAAAVHNAIHRGEPLISRNVTITGSAIGSPRNLNVLLGTPMRELIEQCDGNLDRIERLIMGGPMMGFALHRPDLPVIKTTNCILAATAEDLPPQRPELPCIRCGACADTCPVNLLPQQLYWYSKHQNLDKVQEFNLFDCIECGCCSYVCPSNIPLVQYFRFAKGDIWTQEREKEKSDIARRRHEFRQFRVAREKEERQAKRNRKKAALKADTAVAERDKKKAEIQAAIERTQTRRQDAMKDAEMRRSSYQGRTRDHSTAGSAGQQPENSSDTEQK